MHLILFGPFPRQHLSVPQGFYLLYPWQWQEDFEYFLSLPQFKNGLNTLYLEVLICDLVNTKFNLFSCPIRLQLFYFNSRSRSGREASHVNVSSSVLTWQPQRHSWLASQHHRHRYGAPTLEGVFPHRRRLPTSWESRREGFPQHLHGRWPVEGQSGHPDEPGN